MTRRRHAPFGMSVLAWVATVFGALVLAVGGYLAWGLVSGGLPTSVPSCTWPLRVRGQGTVEQSGLIRCYVRALARHDSAGLLAVADTTSAPPIRISRADFAFSAAARTGTATATFIPNPNDPAYVLVDIAFADGHRESVSMVQTNPGSSHSWRLQIGTHVGKSGPQPAKTSG